MKNETLEVIQSLVKGFNATDRKDFETSSLLWTDEVIIDFGGVKAQQVMKADDLANWAKIAYQHMTTMHITFNHEVNIVGDKATVHSYGRALHKQKVSKGEDFWFIYARYEHELTKVGDVWKVSKLYMLPVFEEGNSNLVNQAYEDALKQQHNQ